MSDQPEDLHIDPLFPTMIDAAEKTAGFVLGSIKTQTNYSTPWSTTPERTAAVVRVLNDQGLRAVKALSPVGVQYAIFNEHDRPAELPAGSLAELLRRYPA